MGKSNRRHVLLLATEPEPFGCRIARRSCFEHCQRSFRMPSVSLPTPNGHRIEGTMSERNSASERGARVDVGLCQIGKYLNNATAACLGKRRVTASPSHAVSAMSSNE